MWAEAEALRTFSGELAFDIGAQVGDAALALAGRFSRIVALEPARESYEKLCQLDLPGLIPVLAAAGDHEGTVDLAEQFGPMQVFTLTDGSQQWGGVPDRWRTVPCTTVDALTREYGPPDLVKVDTEGWEPQIMAGAARTLAAIRPDLYIEIHSAGAGTQIAALITGIYGRAPEVLQLAGVSNSGYYWLLMRRNSTSSQIGAV